MASSPARWRNRSPGDLSIELAEIEATPIAPAIEAATKAARDWARTPLEERFVCLRRAHTALTNLKEELAMGIALETGKPIVEARGEMGAVLGKFELTIEDARAHLMERPVVGGPHPALVRQGARGPAAVIAPFNFPLHLGNGALLAHLVAGNPVIFKPSPLAAVVAGRYAAAMEPCFPAGVFALVQGAAAEARALCLDPRIRAVCFTGSVPAGKALAKELAEDFSKELALELGGRNAAIICADADLDLAARLVADGMSLTCGQRCNSTSRILVDERVTADFLPRLAAALAACTPGDPLRDETRLGPLISEAAVLRYSEIIREPGEWVIPGEVVPEVAGKRGYYVRPAVRQGAARAEVESFVPVADLKTFSAFDEAVARNNASPFGLSAAVFTQSRDLFDAYVAELRAGNIYANLATTFSPSTLPFGGWGLSGNGRPGGRGFVRFCTAEQAVQMSGLS